MPGDAPRRDDPPATKPHHAHAALYLLLGILALIVYGSLFPWSFDFSRGYGVPPWLALHGWPDVIDLFILRDIILNVLLYVPLGAAAALAFARRPGLFAFLGAVLLCGAISFSLECLQVYIPGRDPSLPDVITNTGGGLLGAIAACWFAAALENRMPHVALRDRPAALLLAILAVWQWYPFFPTLTRHRLYMAAVQFWHSPVSPLGVFSAGAAWFAAFLLLHAAFGRSRAAWLTAGFGVLALQLVIAGRTPSRDAALGLLCAILLWAAIPCGLRLQAGLYFLAASIVLQELAPFHFSHTAAPFWMLPFRATFSTDWTSAVATLARKCFEYGCAVWLVRRQGLSLARSALVVAAPLAAFEMLQIYLPGRIPESTDPLLAVLMAGLMAAVEHLPRTRIPETHA